jgi:hypothetical protein
VSLTRAEALKSCGGVSELVQEGALKAPGLRAVWVRLPPPLPMEQRVLVRGGGFCPVQLAFEILTRSFASQRDRDFRRGRALYV